jgi:hypothetical protein
MFSLLPRRVQDAVLCSLRCRKRVNRDISLGRPRLTGYRKEAGLS